MLVELVVLVVVVGARVVVLVDDVVVVVVGTTVVLVVMVVGGREVLVDVLVVGAAVEEVVVFLFAVVDVVEVVVVVVEGGVVVVVDVVVDAVLAQLIAAPVESTYANPAEELPDPFFTPSSMMSLFELLPNALYETIVVLQPPENAVKVNVIVQPAAARHPERLPQTVALPNWVLLMKTSTPLAPVLHVSLPLRSVAPMIVEIMRAPGCSA